MTDSAKRATIVGLGTYVPPRVVTNDDFSKTVETSDEWITQMTGIKERHFVDGDTASSDLAALAGKVALERAGVDPPDVDMVLVATSTPDMFFPCTACLAQDKVGAKNAFAYDVSAGCSGFIYGLVIAHQFIAAGTIETALVIGAETLSRFADMTDRNTCVLFGDGAGAAVVQGCDAPRGLLAYHLGGDGKLGDLLKFPAGGTKMPASHETVDARLHYIKMNGRQVYANAVKAMSDSTLRVLEKAGLSGADVDLFFPHQANIRIMEAVAERARLPMEKVFVNIDRYGNTSAASIPIALDEAVTQGRLTEGMLIGMVAFGTGFTWGAALMRW
ncbi:MAG: ketoacyl-ACP synthase III [Candidatus Eisenbacteria bacterium]|nr:ketoacyl-ACP synthase III [Candidatus Eisenbacteria bacterium]